MTNSLLMKELSVGSLFEKGYILSCMQRGYSDGIDIPAARESAGVRFVAVADFHDAALVAVNVGQRYGRPHVALTADFRTAQVRGQFKNNYSQFVLRFFDVNGFVLPKWQGTAWIVGAALRQTGDRVVADFELTYFEGNTPRYLDLPIDCSGVEVAVLG